MNRSMLFASAAALAAYGVAITVDAGQPPCRTRTIEARGNRVVVVEDALAIAPFAVPVAVPVATIQRPTLIYAYGDYAVSADGHSRHANSLGARDRVLEGTAESANDELTPSVDKNAGDPRSAVELLLQQRCSSCHSESESKGGVTLFDENGALRERLRRRAILDMVSADERGVQQMPPAERAKLSADEIEVIRRWAEPPPDLEY